jgi:tripartite-type tricarboxylate transporter receptor subunit TctC
MPVGYSIRRKSSSTNHLASELFKSLAKVGIESVTNTPAAFSNFMRAEVARWAQVIRGAKIQVK